jgi:AraC-like DNA-binding protein
MGAQQPTHVRRYLPISDADRAWGLHVTCGGFLRTVPGSAYPPPGHPERYSLLWPSGRILDEFQLHFIPRGAGEFECAQDSVRTITAGTVFLLFPGVWHRYRPRPERGWDEYWIGFDGAHARQMMHPPFFSPTQPLIAPTERSAVLEQFTAIVATMQQDPPHLQRLLAGMTGMLLGILQAQIAGDAVDARGARLVQEAKRALSAGVAQAVDGHALARRLGVGYHWLRRAFAQQSGMSMHEYHSQLRVHAAMQQLESTDQTITEIAAAIGFEDAYYFSRVFRKVAGMPPQRWRRQRRGVT